MSNFNKGFNAEQVNASLRSIGNAYDSLMEAACNSMQNDFVNPMGENWAAESAVKVFGNIKECNDSMTQSADQTFESVYNAMNTAAQIWASATEGSYSSVNFASKRKTLDVSAIKSNINGDRGINSEGANSTASKLTSIISNIESALSSAVSAVDNCGFLGSEKGALQNALQQIKTNYSQHMSENYEAMNTEMKNTVEAYGNIETSNSTGMNG